MPLIRRPTKITIHTGGESSRSTSYNSEEEGLSHHEREYSITDDDAEWEDEDDLYDDVHPSDSASASNEIPPSHPRAARTASRHHRLTRPHAQYHPVQAPAPNPPSVDPSEDFVGHYGPAYQPPPAHRGGYYGGRGHPQPYPQNHGGHYMGGYPGGNQMVPYSGYGPNPFTPMSNSSGGGSYFGGDQRHMYDMIPYQHGFYGVPPQYSLPAHMQQFHLSPPPPPPPATEAPAPAPAAPATPAPPKEPPVDIEKIKREAQQAAIEAHEEKQKAIDKMRERDIQIRKEAEDSFLRKMEEMKKQQEEAAREIARARAEAERATVARMEAERKAAEERARQEAEATRRAEENAKRKFEAEMKAAEERRQKEAEERTRIEEAAKIRLETALRAEAEARAAAAKKAAEEAERLKLIQEDAKRKAEAEAAAKVAAEKEAAAKAAEAEANAKKEHEALKQRMQEEAKAKLQEAAKTTEKAPIKFKDAVGRKFSFPFHLCATWQGMEELIKQAFLHVDVIGPHVQQGHYDLTGPNGEIILPSVWEKVIQPDWNISMTMWPVEKMPPLGPKLPGGVPLSGRHRGMGGIPMPHIPGVGPAGHRPGVGMAPPPGWANPAGRRSHGPDGINIVDVGPGPSKPKSKRNSAFATFFAGKPAKKKSSRKAQ